MAVRLRSLVHKELWEERASEHKNVHGERIKQGNFGHVWRARHTDPDGSKKEYCGDQGGDAHTRGWVAGGARVGMS